MKIHHAMFNNILELSNNKLVCVVISMKRKNQASYIWTLFFHHICIRHIYIIHGIFHVFCCSFKSERNNDATLTEKKSPGKT